MSTAASSAAPWVPAQVSPLHLPLLPARAASAGERGLIAVGLSGRGRAGHSSFCLLWGRRAASSGPVAALTVQSFAPDPLEAFYKGRDGEQGRCVSGSTPGPRGKQHILKPHEEAVAGSRGGSWAACPLAQGSALQTAPLPDRSVLSPPQCAGVKGRKNTRACNNKEHNN